MKIQTFRCKSVQAAVQKVRETLGPEASILHIRTVPADDQNARRTVELDATRDITVPSRFETVPDDFIVPFPESRPTAPHHGAATERVPSTAHEEKLQGEPHETQSYAARLIAAGYSEEYVSLFATRAGHVPIGNQLVPAGGQTQVVAFHHLQNSVANILTELAGQFSQALHRESDKQGRVGFLITNPTSTPNLPELLQAAEQLDAAFEVVSEPEAIQPALARMHDCRAIFTELGSVQDSLSQLQHLQPDCNFVCLPGNGSLAELREQLAQYLQLPTAPNSTGIILDLAGGSERERHTGNFLEFFSNLSVPVSYLATATDSQPASRLLTPATSDAVVQHFLSSLASEHENQTSPDSSTPEGLRIFQSANVRVV